MQEIWETTKTYLPSLITAIIACGVAFFAYLKNRANFKAKQTELEIENIQLKKAMIEGSYIICPNCGTKILLKDTKIYMEEIK